MAGQLPFWADPDRQQPLPFPAAEAYARVVMAWAQATLPEEVTAHLGLPYGDHPLQRLDVYTPAGARNAPVLVFWHGGGWTNGYRAYARFMAPQVTRLGFVLVAPSYRLAPAHRLPAAYDDAVAALGHVLQHASEWGGDAQRLVLAGHSAGAHLATLTALRAPPAALRACLPISGIMDLQHPAPPPGSMEERVYAMVLANEELDAVMSPLCWARGNRVPFVLFHGDADSERVQRSNCRLERLLQSQPGPVERHVLADTDHFSSHTRLVRADDAWYGQLARFA